MLAEIDGADDLPHGWGVDTAPGTYRVRPRADRAAFGHSAGPQSWKQFLHPPRQRVWSSGTPNRSRRSRATPSSGCGAATWPPSVCWTGCWPAAPTRTAPTPAGADGAFIVAVNCTEPGGLCFCASMGTGPRCGPGYDLALTELIDGESVDLPGRDRHRRRRRGARRHPAPAGRGRTDRPRRPPRSPRPQRRWAGRCRTGTCAGCSSTPASHRTGSEVASRCLTCGNCTMVCPTCFCTSTSDVTDLTGEHAERWMEWASCFELDFTFVHEGPVRPVRAVAVPALADPQAQQLARPVRHLRLRGLRTVYRLVPHRD